MIKNALLIVLSFTLLLLSKSALASSSILLLGDSLSASYGMKQNEGWVYLLNQQLKNEQADYSIINASISGETTAGGLARFPSILASEEFDYLVIELGGNDGLRGFPTHVIKNNLLQIIKLAKASKIKVFLMDVRIPPNYGPRYNKMFINVFAEVASETEVELLPFFMEQIAVEPHLMQNDGIHPNIKAQEKIVKIMNQQFSRIVRD
ncbi:arylesterase [Thalassotalea atypica]|uniref:arylesterase n=1 Tax=Thalassotalea atypica TaxID=2054316 RepID=UPI0025737093|nr:arylesterase [Thalassotalea atypica]